MKKWALVLSGGGGSGLAHIGAIKALEKMGFFPDLIVGNSIGAVIGCLYACGMPIAEIEKYVIHSFDVLKLLDGFAFHLPNNVFSRVLMAEGAMHNIMIKQGADTGKRILKKLKELTEDKEFDQTKTPFVCTATDLLSGLKVALNKGNIAEAVRASMAFPGVFTPVERHGLLLCDGALTSNLPIWAAREYGYTKIIAIDVDPFFSAHKASLINGLAIVFRGMQILMNRSHKGKEDRATLVITACEANSNFDFNNKTQLIHIGEKAIESQKTALRKALLGTIIRFLK